ncbi:MAG: transposase, partial [Calditrichaeota bacterium]|nr:transposase [Calditrichota bacterium]
MEMKIAFTDKEITPWGGMSLLRNMLDQIDFTTVVEGCPALPQPGSNRGYSPLRIIESFMVSVWCGANRFLHTEVTRHDSVLTQIFGWDQAPGNDTYKRYFSKFNQAVNQRVFDHFYRWYFSQLRFDNFTLDFDSSILTRYGQQEGAKSGYNPKKPGRFSHHPLMAFIADSLMVANFWLRSGDAHSANNFVGFLEDTLNKLNGKQLSLVRLDSGFYDKEVFDYLEKRDLSYIVAARFYRPIKWAIA